MRTRTAPDRRRDRRSALGELSNLLLELEDLVDRSANEAGLSDDEVAANQLQIDSILDSINRISTTTQFKGKKLLDGTLAYTTSGVDTTKLASVRINAAKIPDGGSKNVTVQVTNSAETGTLILSAAGLAATNDVTLQITGRYGNDLFSFAGSSSISTIATAINQSKELTGVSAIASSNNHLYLNSTDFGSDAFVSVQVTSGTFLLKDTAANVTTEDSGLDASVTINGVAAEVNGLRAQRADRQPVGRNLPRAIIRHADGHFRDVHHHRRRRKLCHLAGTDPCRPREPRV